MSEPEWDSESESESEPEIEPVSPSVSEPDEAYEGLVLLIEAWHYSVPEQQAVVENRVLSPVLVPVSTADMSSANDHIPFVDESVEASIFLEPVSAAIPSDDDVEMEEDLTVLPIAGPEFNRVASLSSDEDLPMADEEVVTTVQSGLSDDQHMHDGNDGHQVWMPEAPPAISTSDMELCPQQFPETGAFNEQVVPDFSFGTQQPNWQVSSVVANQFTFGTTVPSTFNFGNPMSSYVPQLQGPEHDMADVPSQPDMVSTHFGGPMVNLTSPVGFVEADTIMDDI